MAIVWEPEFDVVGQGHRRFYGVAAPTLASDIVGFAPAPGDFIWKNNADIGGTIGYMCIAAPSTTFPAGQWVEAQTIQSVAMTFTAAQVNGMFAAPLTILAALGAGTMIEVTEAIFNYVYGSAAFTAGGSIGLFYNTAAGSMAASPLNASFLTAPAVNQIAVMEPNISSVASSTVINQPIVLSNATQAFATGTGGSLIVKVKYRVHIGLS